MAIIDQASCLHITDRCARCRELYCGRCGVIYRPTFGAVCQPGNHKPMYV